MHRPKTWYPYAGLMAVLAFVALLTWYHVAFASGILFGYFATEALRAATVRQARLRARTRNVRKALGGPDAGK